MGVDERTKEAGVVNAALRESAAATVVPISKRSANQCRVCSIAHKPHLPHAALVHRIIGDMLALGCTVPDVLAEVAPYLELWPGSDRPSPDSLERHRRRHMSKEGLVRAASERLEAEEAAASEVILDQAVDAVTTVRLAHLAAFEALQSGEVRPRNLAEVLKAAEADFVMQRISGAGPQKYRAWLEVFAQAIEDVAPREVREAFRARVAALSMGQADPERIRQGDLRPAARARPRPRAGALPPGANRGPAVDGPPGGERESPAAPGPGTAAPRAWWGGEAGDPGEAE